MWICLEKWEMKSGCFSKANQKCESIVKQLLQTISKIFTSPNALVWVHGWSLVYEEYTATILGEHTHVMHTVQAWQLYKEWFLWIFSNAPLKYKRHLDPLDIICFSFTPLTDTWKQNDASENREVLGNIKMEQKPWHLIEKSKLSCKYYC